MIKIRLYFFVVAIISMARDNHKNTKYQVSRMETGFSCEKRCVLCGEPVILRNTRFLVHRIVWHAMIKIAKYQAFRTGARIFVRTKITISDRNWKFNNKKLNSDRKFILDHC